MKDALFPQHEFDPVTHFCKRCGWAEEELSFSYAPRSCMTDAEIAWTLERAKRILAVADIGPAAA